MASICRFGIQAGVVLIGRQADSWPRPANDAIQCQSLNKNAEEDGCICCRDQWSALGIAGKRQHQDERHATSHAYRGSETGKALLDPAGILTAVRVC